MAGVALGAALAWFLRVPLFGSLVGRRIEVALREELGLETEIGRITYFDTGEIAAEDLRVRGLGTVERARARFDLWRLLGGGERPVEWVELVRPRVVLGTDDFLVETADEGSDEGDGEPTTPESVLTDLPEFVVEDGDFEWRPGAPGVRLTGIDLRLRSDGGPRFDLELEAEALVAEAVGRTRRLEGVRLGAHVDPDEGRLEAFAWEGGRLDDPLAVDLSKVAEGEVGARLDAALGLERLDLAGRTWLEGPDRRYRIDVGPTRLALDPVRLAPFAGAGGVDFDLDVRIEGGLSLAETPAGLTGEGRLEVEASGTVEDRPIERLHAVASVEGDRVRLEEALVLFPGGRLAAPGTGRTDGSLSVEVALAATLAEALPALVPDAPAATGRVRLEGRLATRPGPADPRFEGRLEASGAEVAGWPIERLEASVEFTDGALVVPEATARDAYGDEATFAGRLAFPLEEGGWVRARIAVPRLARTLDRAGAGVDLPDDLSAEATVRLEGTLDRLASEISVAVAGHEVRLDVRLSGELADRTSWTGTIEDLAGRWRGHEGRSGGPAAFRLAGKDLEVAGLVLSASGATARVDGIARLDAGTFEARAAVAGLTVELAREFLPPGSIPPAEEFAAEASAEVAASGPFEAPRVEVRVLAPRLAWRGLEGAAEADLAWDGGAVEIRRAVVRHGSGSIDVRGRVDVERATLDLVGRADALPLAAVAPFVPGVATLGGRLDAPEIRIGGPLGAPEFQARFAARDLAVAWAEPDRPAIERAEVEGTFEGRRLTIDRAAVHAEGADLVVHGALDFTSEIPRAERLEVAIRRLDVSLLGQLGAGGVLGGGVIEGRIVVDGPLDAPGLDATLWGRDVVLGALPPSRLEVGLQVIGATATLTSLAFEGPWGHVEARGSVSGIRDVRTAGLAIEVAFLVDLGGLPEWVEVVEAAEGRLCTDRLALSGTVAVPRLAGEVLLHVPSARLRDVPEGIRGLEGRFTFDDRRVRYDLAGLVLDRPLEVREGVIELPPGETPEIHTVVRMEPMEIDSLLTFVQGLEGEEVPDSVRELEGRVGLSAELSGRIDRPFLRAHATVEGARYRELTIDRLSLAVEGDRERLRIIALDVDSDFLVVRDASGSLPLEAGAPGEGLRLALSVGPLDRIAKSFAGGLEGLAGRAEVSVDLGGSVAEPRAALSVSLDDLAFRPTGTEYDVRHVRGRLDYADGALVLDRLSMTVAGGPLTISGRLGVAGRSAGEVELAVEGTSVLVLRYDDLVLRVSPSLRVGGTTGRPKIEGTLDVDHLQILSQIDLEDPTFRLRLPFDNTEGKTADREIALPADLDLDVRIVSRRGLLMENDLLTARASADLTVRGSAAAPVLAGRLVLEETNLTIRGNRIDLAEGEVVWEAGRPWSDPKFRIAGGARINVYDITIRATGSVRAPELDLFSSPTLSERDIYYLIATGEPPSPGQTGPRDATELLLRTIDEKIAFGGKREFLGFDVVVEIDRVRIDLGYGFQLVGRADPFGGVIVEALYRVDFE